MPPGKSPESIFCPLHPVGKLSGKDSDWPNLDPMSAFAVRGWGIMIGSPLPPLRVGKECLVAQEGEVLFPARRGTGQMEAVALHHSRGSSFCFFYFVAEK